MEKQRRSKRLPLSIPVQVYGRTPDNRPFRDITTTDAVSAHGGLIPLTPRVQTGQTVLLVNSFTQEERECRVVYVKPKLWGKNNVAVEFGNDTDSDFWHVYTPIAAPKTNGNGRSH
jgi:hypothetical protein